MNSRHYEVIIVGGGQAGLSVSYHLRRMGIRHVIFERARAGEAWRSERWDSFCLVTPNWQCQLPGYPYAGDDPDGFMTKPEIVEYLEGYVRHFSPPLMEGVEVHRVERSASGGRFHLATSSGNYAADQVVIAVGGYHRPIVPAAAPSIPEAVLQLHSSQYRNPEALPEGAVLVAGSGQSGCQIAEDLHLAGRRVHLCLGDAPRSPRQYRGRDVVAWLDEFGYYDTPIDAHPDADMVRNKTNHYLTGRDGGREIDLRRFALEGMQLYGYLTDIAGEQLRFAPDLKQRLDDADAVYVGICRLIDEYVEKRGVDAPPAPTYEPCWQPSTQPLGLNLRERGITSVIWSFGYRHDFSFVSVPVFDAHGYPEYERGVTREPGLYFMGLSWLYTWGSARFSGVAQDAAHICQHVARKRSAPAPRAWSNGP